MFATSKATHTPVYPSIAIQASPTTQTVGTQTEVDNNRNEPDESVCSLKTIEEEENILDTTYDPSDNDLDSSFEAEKVDIKKI